MNFFSRRNKLVKEFSGYEEVSNNLRLRLLKICKRYLSRRASVGIGQENRWVRGPSLEHELFMEMAKSDVDDIFSRGTYNEVFTAVEIFLDLAKKQASARYRGSILPEFKRAFNYSGCVYFINEDGRS